MRETPNRILDFLTAKPKPAGDACRSNPRRGTSAQIELAWLDGQEWRTIPGLLRDISRGGACLLAGSDPPRTRSARLRVAEGEGSPWVEIQILGVELDNSGMRKIRISFAESCPNFLLRLAVLRGNEPVEQHAAPEGWVAWKPAANE